MHAPETQTVNLANLYFLKIQRANVVIKILKFRVYFFRKNPIPQPEKTLFIVFFEPSLVLCRGSSQYQNVCMCLFEQFSFAQIEK